MLVRETTSVSVQSARQEREEEGGEEDRRRLQEQQQGHPFSVVADSWMLVAPDGPERSWNLVAEESEEADAQYIASTLVSYLANFSNVERRFALLGTSNGAALSNRILIELDEQRIVSIITDSSQLNTHQYRDGKFFVGGDDNSYNSRKSALTSRRVLQIVSGSDIVIPPLGGESRIPAGERGLDGSSQMIFVPWQESAYAIAEAFGYNGARATPQTTAAFEHVSYLEDSVEAFLVFDASHGVAMSHPTAQALVANFLGADVGVLTPLPSSTIGAIAGGGSALAFCICCVVLVRWQMRRKKRSNASKAAPNGSRATA